MCGRFTLSASLENIIQQFDVENELVFFPRYNIAPTQNIPVICQTDNSSRQLVEMRWGLIPSWMKEENIGSGLINARAETIESKPSFRSAFKKRRCLIVADGFYEWKTENDIKVPYYIHLKEKHPFGMAGLWERWVSDAGHAIESCTIITTDANKTLSPIHHRMPVIIAADNYASWLDPGNEDVVQLKTLLTPNSKDQMAFYTVSRHVNNPRNDDSACIEPA